MKPLILLLMWFAVFPVQAADLTIELNGSLEVPVQVFPANSEHLLLVLPSGHGFQQGHELLAKAIADQGTEVWLADLHAAYFLPVSPSSLQEFDAQDIAALIRVVHTKTKKAVYLMSHDRGVVPMLHGVRSWQQSAEGLRGLKGVLAISPNLYVGTPAAGQEIEYRPIARQTNINLYVIQPMLSPKSWQLGSLLNNLEDGGSDVYIQSVDSIRDRFFFRPDATRLEEQAAKRLIGWIQGALSKVSYFDRQRKAVVAGEIKAKAKSGKARKGFLPYTGDLKAEDFELKGLDDETRRLSDYRGKVVLLNFWASWCPPCIHEMPSMQGLKDHFKGLPFEIVAVNMAEDKQTIIGFLQQMDVDFEILMDTDGKVLQQWKVFAYPTSYILDKAGKIRYAGFGAIDWKEKEIVRAIDELVK